MCPIIHDLNPNMVQKTRSEVKYDPNLKIRTEYVLEIKLNKNADQK